MATERTSGHRLASITVVEPQPPINVTLTSASGDPTVIGFEGMPVDTVAEMDFGKIYEVAKVLIGAVIGGSGGGNSGGGGTGAGGGQGGNGGGCATVTVTLKNGATMTMTDCPPKPA